jgi:dynein heavy chain, axonemal
VYRWTESVARLSALYDCLVGDAVVSAGMIAYAGPFTPDFRQKLVKDWQVNTALYTTRHCMHDQ